MKSFEIEERIRAQGRAEGRAAGLAEGIIQGKINDILDMLSELGEVPPSLKEQISEQKDEGTLFAWLKLASKAKSMEEFAKLLSN